MSEIPIGYYSMKILKEPGDGNKGALILSQVDNVVSRLPFVKDKFYLIERRGWRGINESKYADIKLVEDLSLWDETLEKFPESVCLDIGPADFVDIEVFRPLGIKKDYDGIQVSHWTNFKRPEMFVRAAGMLPWRSFVKLGHFVEGGSEPECNLRDSNMGLAIEIGANIDFPDASYPTKKHITDETGALFEPTPEGLAKIIEDVLTNIGGYAPRSYIERTTGKFISLKKLRGALEKICKRDGVEYQFDDIDWDGRNQSLIWGENVFNELRGYKSSL